MPSTDVTLPEREAAAAAGALAAAFDAGFATGFAGCLSAAAGARTRPGSSTRIAGRASLLFVRLHG